MIFMAQKTLTEIPVLRDFQGHRFAGESGYNIFTTPFGSVAVLIRRRE